jgi:hypothetical protein
LLWEDWTVGALPTFGFQEKKVQFEQGGFKKKCKLQISHKIIALAKHIKTL